MSIAVAQVRRDFLVAFRARTDAVHPVAFFALTVVLFGLGMGPDRQAMGELAPGMVWVLALLATMMGTDTLFRRDFEDGTLEQLLLHGRPLFVAVLAKLFAHWCVTGLILTALSPLAGLMLQVPAEGLAALAGSLALGTPALTLIGAIAAALTVGLGRGGMLAAVIALPLFVPVLIFGAGASLAAASGGSPAAELLWLGALLAAALTLAPFAVGLALRVSQEY